MRQSRLLEAQKYLKKVDPTLRKVIEILGDIKLRHRPANFEAFVRIIINQQLSNKAASTIRGRVRERCLPDKIEPNRVLSIGTSSLRDCGLSGAKAKFVEGLANHFLENPSYISQLRRMDIDTALNSLMALKGFGIWSASIFLLFNLRHIDVFPHGDVSIEKAIHHLYGVKIDRRSGGAEDIILVWSPYRSVASLYLWEWIDRGSPRLA